MSERDTKQPRRGRWRREVQRWLAPVLERDLDLRRARELVVDALAVLVERERKARRTTDLRTVARGRDELPALLDEVAREGRFSAVLLSDDVGLPIAASSGARDAEVLAGISSLVLTLADRLVKAGEPVPLAILVRDDAGGLVLHRILTVGEERFLITGVGRDPTLTSEALDPVLPALESALARS